MTREEYIGYRKNRDITTVAFHYYNEKGGTFIPFNIFVSQFQIFHMMSKLDWSLLWRYYDIKFQLYILERISTREELLIF